MRFWLKLFLTFAVTVGTSWAVHSYWVREVYFSVEWQHTVKAGQKEEATRMLDAYGKKRAAHEGTQFIGPPGDGEPSK